MLAGIQTDILKSYFSFLKGEKREAFLNQIYHGLSMYLEKEMVREFLNGFFENEKDEQEMAFMLGKRFPAMIRTRSKRHYSHFEFLLILKELNKAVQAFIPFFSSDHYVQVSVSNFLFSLFDKSETIFLDNSTVRERSKHIDEKLIFKKVVENSIDGIFAFDNTLRCSVWNSQMEIFTGQRKVNSIKKPVYELFPYKKEFSKEVLEKVLNGEILFYSNFWFSDPSLQFEVYIMPLYDKGLKINGASVVVHNITERLLVEENVRQLTDSLEHTVEGIALIDLDGNFIMANPSLALILGCEKERLTGGNWLDFLSLENGERALDKLEKAKNCYKTFFETQIDVSGKFVEITIVPFFDKNAFEKGFHLFYRDISERKNVENRLKRSEALLTEVQELARLGIWEFDVKSKEVNWSDEIFRMVGLKPKEIKPSVEIILKLIPKETMNVVQKTVDKILNDFKPYNFETFLVLPDKTIRFIYGQAKPIFNTEGKIIKLSGYVQDITERKEAEKILMEAYEELKRAEENLVKINSRLENRVKDRTEELSRINRQLQEKNEELIRINLDLDNFVYTASHDLKSPISNIEGLVIALQEEIKSRNIDDFEHLIAMINTSINKFKTTIKDLTEITKIQKNLDQEIAEVDLHELVNEVCFDLKEIIDSSHTKINLIFEADKIFFSRRNIRSIFYNLISNAIKYKSSERNPLILISVKKIENSVLISIKDNGLGLEVGQKDKIFKMFKRMHTHVEGTGIGLYIVKRIVENSGGKILVESELGVGTEFEIFLRETKR